jgi:hypothetical protein
MDFQSQSTEQAQTDTPGLSRIDQAPGFFLGIG